MYLKTVMKTTECSMFNPFSVILSIYFPVSRLCAEVVTLTANFIFVGKLGISPTAIKCLTFNSLGRACVEPRVSLSKAHKNSQPAIFFAFLYDSFNFLR